MSGYDDTEDRFISRILSIFEVDVELGIDYTDGLGLYLPRKSFIGNMDYRWRNLNKMKVIIGLISISLPVFMAI